MSQDLVNCKFYGGPLDGRVEAIKSGVTKYHVYVKRNIKTENIFNHTTISDVSIEICEYIRLDTVAHQSSKEIRMFHSCHSQACPFYSDNRNKIRESIIQIQNSIIKILLMNLEKDLINVYLTRLLHQWQKYRYEFYDRSPEELSITNIEIEEANLFSKEKI